MVLNEDIHEFDNLEGNKLKRILKPFAAEIKAKCINILGWCKTCLRNHKKHQ